MLVITCPHCKNPVPSSATTCPWCAHPDPSHKKRNATIAAFVFGAMVVVMTAAYLWFMELPQVFNLFKA
jgi:predicted nucleic acid-binding Zn ribbon protein